MYDLKLIEILENQLNNLYIYKKELEKNKPLFFQRKKLKIYHEKINYLNNKINEYNQKLLKAYIELEKK